MKYLSIIRYILLAISVLLVALYFAGVTSEVDAMMNWMYIVLGISVVAAVVFPLINLASNPKSAIRSLIGLVVIAVVLVIAYSLSDATTIVTPVNTFDNPTELKLSDTGLYATYVALGAAILSIIGFEVYNVVKK